MPAMVSSGYWHTAKALIRHLLFEESSGRPVLKSRHNPASHIQPSLPVQPLASKTELRGRDTLIADCPEAQPPDTTFVPLGQTAVIGPKLHSVITPCACPCSCESAFVQKTIKDIVRVSNFFFIFYIPLGVRRHIKLDVRAI